MFYCNHCSRRYKSKASLRNHISLYHKSKETRNLAKTFKCKTCGENFNSPTKYFKHKKDAHPSLLLIDHQPDVNHEVPENNVPETPANVYPPLPESDSEDVYPLPPPKPTKRKADFDDSDNKRIKTDSIPPSDAKIPESLPTIEDKLLKRKIKKYKALCRELEAQLADLQSEKEDLLDENRECKRQVLQLKDEIEDLLEKNNILSEKVANINSDMISNYAFKCTSIEEFAYLRNLFREGDYSKINNPKVIRIIQRLLMALNAGYIPICNKQQAQVTENQRKIIKKLEGASVGEAKRIMQTQFNDISSVFNVIDKSIRFIVDTYKDY